MNPTQQERIRQAREVFARLHPGLFDLERPVPFSVGIHDEMKALYPAVPKVVLKGLFWWLTRRKAYLESCKPGAQRFGLNGPSGHVSGKEAAYARKLHAEQNASSKARKKAARVFFKKHSGVYP